MLCVIGKLDDRATDRLRNLLNTPLYGHITLATYLGDDEPQFIQYCKGLDISPFQVEYTKAEVLDATSIIVATPEKTGMLDALNRCITDQYNSMLDPWTQRERWYPHTTLFYGPNTDLHALCREIGFTPFKAGIHRIEFSRVVESGYDIVDYR